MRWPTAVGRWQPGVSPGCQRRPAPRLDGREHRRLSSTLRPVASVRTERRPSGRPIRSTAPFDEGGLRSCPPTWYRVNFKEEEPLLRQRMTGAVVMGALLPGCLRYCRQCFVDQGLRVLDDAAQVVLALKALGIDLVDILGAGRAGGEPAVRGHHLQPADGRAVARRRGEHARDRLAGQLGGRGSAPATSCASSAFCSGVAGASMRRRRGSPNSRGELADRCSPGSRPSTRRHLRRQQAQDRCRLCRWSTPCRRAAGTTPRRSPRRRSPASRRAGRRRTT